MFSSLFGSSPAQLANNPSSQASMSIGQLAGLASAQFNQAYSQYAQQGMNQQLAAQQYSAAQQRIFNQSWTDERWMIDGKYMSLQEFVDFIWPEDCPDKTFFVLKHTKEISND